MDGIPVATPGEERLVELPRHTRIRDGCLEWTREQIGVDHSAAYANYERDPKAYLDLLSMPRGRLDDDLLIEFAGLWRGDDAGIAEFASRRGVLYAGKPPEGSTVKGWPADSLESVEWTPDGKIAKDVGLFLECDQPYLITYPEETHVEEVVASHWDRDAALLDKFIQATDKVLVEAPIVWKREPLAVWRNASATVDLLMRFAIALRGADGPVHPLQTAREWGFWLPPNGDKEWDNWRKWPLGVVAHLMWTDAGAGNYSQRIGLSEQRSQLNLFLNALCRVAKPSIGVQWGDTPVPVPVIRLPLDQSAGFEPFHVFPAVVVQLLTEVTGGSQEICPECARFFQTLGRERRCEDCTAAAGRARKRRHWNKEKDTYNAARRVKQI